MVNDPRFLKKDRDVFLKISTGGLNSTLRGMATGTAILRNGVGEKIIFHDVILVPDLNCSLISLSNLFSESILIKKRDLSNVIITVDSHYQLSGSLVNNLVELTTAHFEEIEPTVSTCYMNKIHTEKWHARLGHPSKKYQLMTVPQSQLSECQVCRLLHQPLEALDVDLVGPLSWKSSSGHAYFLTIKNKAANALWEFVTNAEVITQHKLKTIVSDGGGKFVNQELNQLLKEKGVTHHITPAYTPQNNGLVERTNQIILVKAFCLLNQSKLPNSFWAEAVNTAAEVSKLLLSASRNMESPYLRWFNKTPPLNYLRPFGAKTYCLIPKQRQTFKLNPTADSGIFLGYSNKFWTFKVYIPSLKKAVLTRNIHCDEFDFPGLRNQPNHADLVYDQSLLPTLPTKSTAVIQEPEGVIQSPELNPVTKNIPSKIISSDISTNKILLTAPTLRSPTCNPSTPPILPSGRRR
ncbi:uncharacterized protein VP01_3813g1 [Puccinia sorghi]|uniref:Integrase catalytic domain-containing protein n=1 Tax=Puccinia sorghi TaxID=27349 RepID=A0A0L6UTA7_9BASI|nr:uncharacterized protein VP01_3813g1 [Puccinia sorghi]